MPRDTFLFSVSYENMCYVFLACRQQVLFFDKESNLDTSMTQEIVTSYSGSHEPVSTGEKFAILLFAITCIQAAFLQPEITIVSGERAKLFTGFLCALSLVASVLFVRRPLKCGSLLEIGISVLLGVIIALSGLMSATVFSSSLRGLVVIASAAGGFWCARILLHSNSRQALFTKFCLVLLAAIALLAILGQIIAGDIVYLLDVNKHPIACRILLLWFAPLALILRGGKTNTIVGVSLLCLSYVVFLAGNLRSAVLIPLVLGIIATTSGAMKPKHLVAILVPLSLIVGTFFHFLPKEKIELEYEPAYYRAENYPFSWHIAKKNPILGIGLRSPRDGYLEDYEIKYPYVTKEKFQESVSFIVTSENVFLNFMVDLGFPFLILYVACLVVLLIRLIRSLRKPDPRSYLPPLALLLPITAGLLDFQILDGLLHPHISWYFHILLGMIAYPAWEQKASD
jgi:hypothetical protein